MLILRDRITNILKNHHLKPEPVHFKIIPLVGIVICPERRYITTIDCTHKEDLQNPEKIINEWFYYKIET